jgi:hypothetical protein
MVRLGLVPLLARLKMDLAFGPEVNQINMILWHILPLTPVKLPTVWLEQQELTVVSLSMEPSTSAALTFAAIKALLSSSVCLLSYKVVYVNEE